MNRFQTHPRHQMLNPNAILSYPSITLLSYSQRISLYPNLTPALGSHCPGFRHPLLSCPSPFPPAPAPGTPPNLMPISGLHIPACTGGACGIGAGICGSLRCEILDLESLEYEDWLIRGPCFTLADRRARGSSGSCCLSERLEMGGSERSLLVAY
jgi:hypothetical protein